MLRRHVMTVAGLWPTPPAKPPLNAHVFGRVEGEDYTIEKVYFESYPGFFCDRQAAQLKTYLEDQAIEQLKARWPSDAESLDAFRKTYGAAYRHVLAARLPGETQRHRRGRVERDEFTVVKQVLARSDQKDWIPSVWLKPKEASQTATLVVAPSGKQVLFWQDGEPVGWVRQLLTKGQSVLSIDPFKIGEHVLPEGPETKRDESFEFFTTFKPEI